LPPAPRSRGLSHSPPRCDADPLWSIGPREFATGRATYNEDGRPATYTVAPGDAEVAIEQRFCLTGEELWGDLNRARFCTENRYPIQPGDVFNLDPATITTVGTDLGGCATGSP
jgi:hypothetical protein